jgi:hypothetical protein
MKKKHYISMTLSKPFGGFLKDGKPITDVEAREIWESGTGDWSQGAFQEMARRVMA